MNICVYGCFLNEIWYTVCINTMYICVNCMLALVIPPLPLFQQVVAKLALAAATAAGVSQNEVAPWGNVQRDPKEFSKIGNQVVLSNIIGFEFPFWHDVVFKRVAQSPCCVGGISSCFGHTQAQRISAWSAAKSSSNQAGTSWCKFYC